MFAKLAETYRTFGDLVGALDAAQTEKSLAERIAATGPDEQRDLADGHRRIGEALELQGEIAGARKEYEAGLGILEPLATKDPSNSDLSYDLTDARLDLGDILRARKRARCSGAHHRAGK